MMTMRMQILLGLLLFLSVPTSSSIFTLRDTGGATSKCLDGSNAKFYTYDGAETSKFIVYFEGGYLCLGADQNAMLDDCVTRSSTEFGSSNTYGSTRDLSSRTLLSSDPVKNPLFHNYTKAYFPYCDGSLHQGTLTNPVNHGGTNLYFRGQDNTITYFTMMNSLYQFYSADEIIVTGVSAGSMGALFWSNYLRTQITNQDNLYMIGDSSYFDNYFNHYQLNQPTFYNALLPLFQMLAAGGSVIPLA